jgi:hypothetical protein
MENESEKISFVPFNAINEFMLDEYRKKVIDQVLAVRSEGGADKATVDKLIKQTVSVPGFRNPTSAPASLLYKPVLSSFEKIPGMTAQFLQIWSKHHDALAVQITELLISLHWEILPADADRTRLPGFQTVWPEGTNFETVFSAYHLKYPDSTAEKDDVALMTVWISNRLPLNSDED